MGWRVGVAYYNRICCSSSLHAVAAHAIVAPRRRYAVRQRVGDQPRVSRRLLATIERSRR